MANTPAPAHTHNGWTTAKLRTAARQASGAGRYQEAAELFDLAADRYPADLHGELGACDIAKLRREAKACRIASLQLVAA